MAKRNANGEGTIFKRKRDGRWFAELIVGWDENGKKKVLRYGAKTRTEVSDWLTERRSERNKGTLTEPTKQTVANFIKDWIETTASHQVKQRTVAHYREILKHYLEPGLGHYQLQKLTSQQIQKFYHSQVERGLSPRTVQLMHSVLRRALRQAQEWGLIIRNPAALAKPPRLQVKETTFLTPEEVIRFLDAARTNRLHAFYALAVTVGLRLGELLGLRWQDINLEAGRLSVNQTLVKISGSKEHKQKEKLIFDTPKTKGSRRTIDLPEVAIEALRKWRREQAEDRLKLGEAWVHPELVFTTLVGTPINPNHIRNRSFRKILAEANCPRIRFHDLRHTAATLMLFQGVEARVLQEVLGHSDIRMTLGLYAHVIPSQKKDAAQKMDAFLAAHNKAR